jgi:hypothetical protein
MVKKNNSSRSWENFSIAADDPSALLEFGEFRAVGSEFFGHSEGPQTTKRFFEFRLLGREGFAIRFFSPVIARKRRRVFETPPLPQARRRKAESKDVAAFPISEVVLRLEPRVGKMGYVVMAKSLFYQEFPARFVFSGQRFAFEPRSFPSFGIRPGFEQINARMRERKAFVEGF